MEITGEWLESVSLEPRPISDIKQDRMDLASLLERVRKSDREAAAELALRYAPEIRRRIRGKLTPELRRLFDSEDILATVLRRLDYYVQNTPIKSTSEREVRTLLLRICNRAVVDKMKILRRLQRTEGEDSAFAALMLGTISSGAQEITESDDGALAAVFRRVPSGEDRTILWLWLAGQDHEAIGATLGKSNSAIRKRWQRIKESLRDTLGQEPRS